METNHLRRIFSPVLKYTCFENTFCLSLLAKSQKKSAGKTSAILRRRYNNCLDAANLYSRTLKPSTKTCVFKNLK